MYVYINRIKLNKIKRKEIEKVREIYIRKNNKKDIVCKIIIFFSFNFICLFIFSNDTIQLSVCTVEFV